MQAGGHFPAPYTPTPCRWVPSAWGLLDWGRPSIQIFAATPLHCPDLRLRGSSGLPTGCPPYPGFGRYTATRPGQAGKRRLRGSDARTRPPPPSDRPKHGRRAEHAARKARSRRNRQGHLVPYLVTQQPKSSSYAYAHPEKVNDIKKIFGSGERT